MGDLLSGLRDLGHTRRRSDGELLRRILVHFKPHRRAVLAVAGAIVLGAMVETALPLLLARGVDWLQTAATPSKLLGLVGFILLATVTSWACHYVRQRETARIVGNVVLRLQQQAFAAVLRQDMSFFDTRKSGQIASYVTADTQAFASVITLGVNFLGQLVLVALVAAVLVHVHPALALAALGMSVLLIIAALGFRKLGRATTRQARSILATVNALVQESIRAILIAKNFRREERVYERFQQSNAQLYTVSLRQGFVFASIMPILNVLTGMGLGLVIYVGSRAVLSGDATAGQWFLATQLLGVLWLPLTEVASFWSQFQLGLAAAERVFDLLEQQPRVVQRGDRLPPRFTGRIEFKNVRFGYGSQADVFQGLDLVVSAGEKVGLVGHTGSGKTSLTRLLARFYEFSEGEVLVDGHDVREFELGAYRRQLGIVPQHPMLLNGTILDNIRYVRPEATEQEVAAITASIGAGQWMAAFPDGLATAVGENGRNLSLGQRQLVALARVLLLDPAIVILDEATASVDPLTEVQIHESLRSVLAGRTAVVIAHRLSTVRGLDRIVALRQGHIIEQGTHDGLLAQGGYYAELYEKFYRHQEVHYEPPAA
ncbi:ABC transporter related protein [Corallococcus coralloides DSM 2259]|uniref:ABC transporter related protein n=1 Tax=Corallococcus coralloides (strain ATCC 25202 / DSM 2259 / NBRC 100086 / M2) TaxID=1144275 RepID=H8MG45_CORCM|nr:ABC transporter ATP-binding protein [Corallococcus coralloides]AFE11058.1 ABC transporter related protein [Corallococcus coralloides DSM 2259]